MIRPATREDIPQFIPLAMEALSLQPYSTMVPSLAKVSALVDRAVGNVQDFVWVSEHDGQLQGALAALVEPLVLYERNQAQVVMWYCKHPGDGARLMRRFLAWLRTRPMIKQAVYSPEAFGDPRITELVQRMGWDEVLPTFVITR